VIADHKRTKRYQPSGAIAAENSCPKLTEVVSSSAEAKKCDVEPARATQKKLGAAQSLKEASIAIIATNNEDFVDLSLKNSETISFLPLTGMFK